MGQRKAVCAWRAAFLRALGASGSVTGAARVAGVDKGTAYDHRKRDADFAAAWDAAKLEAQVALTAGGAAGGAAGRPVVLAADEIVRASKHGRPCVMRAGPGRWSAGKEIVFLEELATDANVTRAAAVAGVSTVAVYKRRAAWPGFAERWHAALTQGYARLEALLIHQATSTLSGEPVAGNEGVRPSFAEAFALFRLHRHAVTGLGERPRHGWRQVEPDIEEVRAEVMRRIKVMGG